MSKYSKDLDFDNAGVPEFGDEVLVRDPRVDDPEPYKNFNVLGHGEYKLSRNGKSDGKVYREKDLLEDSTYAGGRQSRKILPPARPARTAKRKSPRVYNLPPSSPESGSQAWLEDPTGHESGSLSVQGSDGTTQKDVERFEPGLSGLSDCSTVNGDDDKLPETLSREDLSKFEPSTYSMRIGVHEASLDVINVGEERQKAREEREKAREERVEAVEPQGTDPKSYKIYGALGDNRYKLSTKRIPNGKVYRAQDFLDNKPLQAIGGLWKASGENPKAIDEQAKAIEEHVKGREERAKAVEVDMKSHKRGDVHGSLAKPLKLEREEIEPNVFDGEISGGGLKMPFIKTETENGLQDLARDTRIATGPGTKHDWIDSLLSKLSVRGVFTHPLRQSPPKGTRRWSFKSPFSVFGLGECSLEREKTRVRWRCVCGRQMYDDFIELRPGAAADLEKWLNHSIRNHAVNRASNSSQDSTLRSSNTSSQGVSRQRQTAGSDISLQPLSWTASRLPDSDRNAAVAIDVYLEKCWLLICGQPRKGPDSLLAQLDLSSKPSDRELFDGMRKFHSSLRDVFTLQPVLKGVQTIRFVQFQLHKMARVDIRKFPDMPPETMRDQYLYEPYDLIPPVGENLMTHWFQHPEEAWDLPYAYSLFPKKRNGQLDVDLSQGPNVAWGIQIVEGWLASRIWLLGLSLFLCGSLAFGICWTVFKHDIQGAFGVSAYIVALLTLAIGATQANFG